MTMNKYYDFLNISKKETGLNNHICISTSTGRPIPRIKVFIAEDPREFISVSIEDNPRKIAGKKGAVSEKDLALVFRWIIKNKERLLYYWYADELVYAIDLIDSLEKL